MLIIERGYGPGATFPEYWCSVDALELQIEAWPNRNVLLRIEDSAGSLIMELVNPEPGMRIRVTQGEAPRRITLFTREAHGLYSAAVCRIRVISDSVMVTQPKQEAQGVRITTAGAITVPTATPTALGEFTAWRTGLVRVAGTVSADPTSLDFSLFSLYSTGGVITHLVRNTGAIAHRNVPYEYSLRNGADSFSVPAVIAGRHYRLSVQHGAGGDIGITADIYIEPVALN